ncbi:MAG: adenylate/guanylate cyclase domain-containing protein [Deltaproteobacteria bacterium]|nr:adenylate/guanylate cyclase domain-containing protein [Deltaproteobacteria bacterium]
MRLRDGTLGQQALFAALVAVSLLGVAIAVVDKFDRLGTANVGWLLDGPYASPTNEDASEAGLRGGGLVLSINGLPLPPHLRTGHTTGPGARTELGSTNTLVFRSVHGGVRELVLPVRPWQWGDFAFTMGASDVIGVFFLAVGVVTFVLRPYELASWALLSLSTFVSATLLTVFVPTDSGGHAAYFLFCVGVVIYLPFHTALAFPVPHRWLLERRGVLWAIYIAGMAQGGANLIAWHRQYVGPFAYTRAVGSAVLLASISALIARSAGLALRASDPLVAQRARILLGGALLGIVPFAVVQFTRELIGVIEIDNRFLMWPLAFFVLALARITLRPALLNARIAVRRAVLYTAAVAVLSVVALFLVNMRPYLVAVLLFPLLYYWPRFDARLNRVLYPQRARFPELLRGVSDELATAPSVEAVLDALASAPARLCDATSAVAFLLPRATGGGEVRRRVGLPPDDRQHGLDSELLIQILCATRREIRREQLTVEPQFTHIREECRAGFDRLGADLLLPLVHAQRVIGGLAIGPRASGDPYEADELDALANVAQQAGQALMRVEATEQLRRRELEFADLKRFFPPQIIDQVMARGGAAELGNQRKLVTVLFADLRGFTAFSDSVEPEEVIATLGEYHAAVGARIAEAGGTLEHFAGDGLMVFFNDPVDQPDHIERAARLALAMRDDVTRLRGIWTRQGYMIHIGVGIHTGYATCGFIGYEGRRDYAVIGNVTNLAARLSDAAAPGEILISARSYGALERGFLAEPLGDLTFKGFHQPQPVFRLIGPTAGGRLSATAG